MYGTITVCSIQLLFLKPKASKVYGCISQIQRCHSRELECRQTHTIWEVKLCKKKTNLSGMTSQIKDLKVQDKL